jgi:hypothetical protein
MGLFDDVKPHRHEHDSDGGFCRICHMTAVEKGYHEITRTL